MQTNTCIQCRDFPCTNVLHEAYRAPEVDIDPAKVKMIMISEAAPSQAADYYYVPGSLFENTTIQAFNDAGVKVDTIEDLLERGIYLTTAVKCAKTGYNIETKTVVQCSQLLEQELALFPNVQVLMLMGDVAIKSLNAIAKRLKEPRVIPAAATYKIRGGEFTFQGRRVLPSYLQAGPSFFIEKVKRQTIAEDIARAIILMKTSA